MAEQTLNRILAQRNYRFLAVVFLPIVVFFLVLQSYLYYKEMLSLKIQLESWLTRNQSKITQNIYLLNHVELKNIIGNGKEKGSPQMIEVWSSNGKLLATNSPGNKWKNKEKKSVSSGSYINWKFGTVEMTQPLVLVGKKLGVLHLQSQYPWEKLKQEAQGLLILCLALFAILTLAAARLKKVLNLHIIVPIEKLQGKMNPSIHSLSELEPISVGEMKRNYPIEVTNLYSGYNHLIQTVKELQIKETEYADRSAKLKIAAQVAHDIRSPLMVINMTLDELAFLSEDQRNLLQGAVGRINSIASELLEKNKVLQPKGATLKNVSSLVNEIVVEKKLQYSSLTDTEIHFSDESQGGTAQLMENDFKRTLSNLIDNAVESMPFGGKITLLLTQTEAGLSLTVQDQGVGIPSEILPNLFKEGASYGKLNGNGLGLYFAKKSIESFGGNLKLDSSVGFGTTVSVFLPH